ncbi:MAG: hypothetical protein H6716_23450 [Polyangiaceae bacterium]|nr:hypothetical protein [Polyangiaceae bacterium]
MFRHAPTLDPVATLPVTVVQTPLLAPLMPTTTIAELLRAPRTQAHRTTADLPSITPRAQRHQLPASGTTAREETLGFGDLLSRHGMNLPIR